jgi:Ca-activated chloride channel family protein
MELRRDPATGELRDTSPQPAAPGRGARTILRAQVSLVEVGCNALAPDGTHIRGLGREDFRLFEDGIEQPIAHFDASSAPASIALVMDASPSVYRELEEMKAAARALAGKLSPLDDVAVVAFAGQAYLLLPFSRDRALLERAIGSVDLALGRADAGGSNIYRAVYLTARELFPGRTGRKAIVLLTDGQDSGLGLSWDPASATPRPRETSPQAGERPGRLTFEDVARQLAAAGVEVYAVSTQPRPKAMTDAWLAARQNAMLVTPTARDLGMPHYTLYLAELVRRAGGRVFFLRELGTLREVYRRIAETLSAQYTLGYYPAAGTGNPGWRAVRVELRGRSDVPATMHGARLTHRVAYYVPAAP